MQKLSEEAKQAIVEKALATYLALQQVRDRLETEMEIFAFYYTLSCINLSLPSVYYKPPPSTLNQLIRLGSIVEGHPVQAWQTLGKSMMFLGVTIAVSAGIALSVSSIALLSPLGISLAAASIGGAIGGIVGVGFFAHGQKRTGLSKNITELADAEKEVFFTPNTPG